MARLKEMFKDMESVGEAMSNFDGKINEGMEEKLKSGKFYGTYPAWNFHGTVWFDGVFKCGIMQYHHHTATIEGESLQEIMDEACERYGTD